MLDREIRKAVVYLDPAEFKSTWLGNKAVYRTRMALADDAELIVLAPGVKEFGEDAAIDKLIRKYGYVGTPRGARGGPGKRRPGRQPERRRAPDPRLLRGSLLDHLLPGTSHPPGDRERQLPLRIAG